MPKKITIGLIQTKTSDSLSANFAKTATMVEKVAAKGAQIICLQELYNTPYFPQRQHEDKDKYAEYIPGASTSMFEEIAKDYGIVIIVPVYEKAKNKHGKWEYYNSAAVINEKGMLMKEVYRKVHIPQDPGFYEKDYFESGKSGYKIYKTKFASFAVLICYDQWFPEAARAARLQGAEIIFYPTALGNIVGYKPEGDWHGAWETAMRGHAIANSVHVAAVNRVGREGNMKFFGQTFVCDPFGKVLKRASAGKEEALIAKIDLSRNKFFADGWGFLRNRRPDTYGILTSDKLVEKSRKLKDVAHYKDEIKALEK
ncbi:MAG: carbon-nitrogen hydrolase [Patescibacteria group bacterium]|nr:carbon-nitrogen hydrolase [Patescibacteria group bacterium]